MRPRAVVVVLLLGLAACASPAPAPLPPSATPAPSATPLPSRTPTASHIPSQTSTATPVPRWREYEIAIAEAIGDPNARCEWYILGMEAEKVYLDVTCMKARGRSSLPAVLYLGREGTIEHVWIPGAAQRQREIIRTTLGDLYTAWLQHDPGDDPLQDAAYLQNRRNGTPPAVVLSGTPLPPYSPTPTPLPRWREYEVAIAKAIVDPYARCEWHLLGIKLRAVYLDVICRGDKGGVGYPAVVYLSEEGSIENVWVPSELVEVRGEKEAALGDMLPRWRASVWEEDWLWDDEYYQRRLDGTPPAIVLTGTPLP